jgi:3-phosphoshikimate 1-carboxyvinyltransferase
MKSIKVQSYRTHLKGTIQLPSSKSISNRALILQAIYQQIYQKNITLQNLSEAEDTVILSQSLLKQEGTVNIKNAGTCARFLCAYYAAKPQTEIVLDGEERMYQRPIAPLVEALRQLGANITYLKEEGFLPLHIKGQQLTGAHLNIDATASSQFVSALMLVSPMLGGGLTLTLPKETVSKTYITMTLGVMNAFGLKPSWDEANLTVTCPPQTEPACIDHYQIEADWSSAAFFYEAALLAEEAKLTLSGLTLPSLQGDAVLAHWFKELGVESELGQTGITITKAREVQGEAVAFNFTHHPDLAPAIICACAGAGIAINASGLKSLVHKESNRVLALINALKVLHIKTESDQENYIAHDGLQRHFYHGEILQTQHDHRLAMAFGMLALFLSVVRLSEGKSVVKSFPSFWDEAAKLGLEVA